MQMYPDQRSAIQYIAIHVRHGDFRNWCWQAENPDDCFAPLSVIARRVRYVRIRESLRRTGSSRLPTSCYQGSAR